MRWDSIRRALSKGVTSSLLCYNQITLTAVLQVDCKSGNEKTRENAISVIKKREDAGTDQIITVEVVRSTQILGRI